jgi:hypothetical protein
MYSKNDAAPGSSGAHARGSCAPQAYTSPFRRQVRNHLSGISSFHLPGKIREAMERGHVATAAMLIREHERRINWARNWRRAHGG